MNLFLLRHAAAADSYPDEARPLSRVGFDQIENLCGHLNPLAFSFVPQIWHSGFVRSRQTAEAFARQMGINAQIVLSSDFRPGDDPAAAARSIAAISSFGMDLLVVGHNPHLESLTSLILFDGDKCKIQFSTCSIARLSLDASPSADHPLGVWSLSFFITPDNNLLNLHRG